MQSRKHQKEFLAFLLRECAQSRPEATVTLSVISGTSFLAFTRFSEGAAHALVGVVRLFI